MTPAKAGDIVFQFGFICNGSAVYYKVGNSDASGRTPDDETAFESKWNGSVAGWPSGAASGRVVIIKKDTTVFNSVILRPKQHITP